MYPIAPLFLVLLFIFQTTTAKAISPTEKVVKTALLSVIDQTDTTPPAAEITSPARDSKVRLTSQITGTASDANFAYYTLSISAKGKNNFTELINSRTEVTNGVLGEIDATLMKNGLYDVKLEVRDLSGNISTDIITYQVTGKAKIGNFSFTVTDFDISVGGLPVRLNRTYSTLQKSDSQDMGYGWSVDYENVKVEENIIPGKSWRLTPDVLTGYCFKPDASHIVAITLPDGTTEEFEIRFARECGHYAAGSFYDAPKFYALGGSQAKLEALNAPAFVTINSSGDMLDSGNMLFNPKEYRLTLSNGMIYDVDENFGLKLVTDQRADTLTYSSNGIISSRGESLTFTRDELGRIIIVTDLSGKSMQYHYNDAGDLAYVIDQMDNNTTYTYDADHTLTEYIDPSGVKVAKNYYDAGGRLIKVVDANGNEVIFTHNINGRQEVVQDKLGRTTIYVYDDEGNVLQTTNPEGETTTYTYDSKGNTLTTTDALGFTTTNTYDANGNILSTTDALGNKEITAYNTYSSPTSISDKNSNTLNITYNAYNNPVSMTTASGAVTHYTYDNFGNKLTSKDENNLTTTYEYDSNYIPFLGATSSKGNLLKTTKPDGTIITNSYDESSNLLSTTTTYADGTSISTSNTYDAFNRVITNTDELGNITTYTYDARGNKVSQRDSKNRTTTYTYAANNSLIKTTYHDGTFESKTYDAMGNTLSETDIEGQTTLYEYDKADRLVKTTYADGSFTTTSYDSAGRVTSTTDANGNITTYTYDKVGNQISVTDALGNTTTFTYDAQGNRLSTTDALGRTTKYEYNKLNQLVKTTYPDGSFTQELKNISGLPSKRIDANLNVKRTAKMTT